MRSVTKPSLASWRLILLLSSPDGGLAQVVSAMETKQQGGNLTVPPPLRTIKMGSKENTDILTIKQPHHTDVESHQSGCEIGFQGLSTVLAARNLFLHACYRIQLWILPLMVWRGEMGNCNKNKENVEEGRFSATNASGWALAGLELGHIRSATTPRVLCT